MVESSWLSKSSMLEAGSNLARGSPREIQSEIMRQDLEKRKVSKEHRKTETL